MLSKLEVGYSLSDGFNIDGGFYVNIPINSDIDLKFIKFNNINLEIGGEKVQVANVCRDASKLATSVTADYITAGYGVPRPATAGWTWAKRMGFDSNLPEVLIPSVNGASSSTGTRDGFYEEADTATGLREWLRFGDLYHGVGYAGLSCGYGDCGLGTARWYVGGRLSVTGNRGEFQAAA